SETTRPTTGRYTTMRDSTGAVLDIRDRGQAPCRHVTDLLDTRLDVIDRQLAELAQLRTTIADLREDAAAGDPATCSPEDVCRYL
ncbi:MerR family DNA-binding protein, partial [Micrococcus sp. Mcc89]|uniref:MerR family DNA-binding protein n=1 Tax=Micrococcus sp. Mcc89 TaxID=2926014 RepID=UPI002119012B